MDRAMRVLLFGVGMAMVMLAVSRQRLAPARSLRPAGPAQSSRDQRESNMDGALESPQINRSIFSSLGALLGAFADTLKTEQALALRATEKAALHRRKLAELRAMYVRPLDR